MINKSANGVFKRVSVRCESLEILERADVNSFYVKFVSCGKNATIPPPCCVVFETRSPFLNRVFAIVQSCLCIIVRIQVLAGV